MNEEKNFTPHIVAYSVVLTCFILRFSNPLSPGTTFWTSLTDTALVFGGSIVAITMVGFFVELALAVSSKWTTAGRVVAVVLSLLLIAVLNVSFREDAAQRVARAEAEAAEEAEAEAEEWSKEFMKASRSGVERELYDIHRLVDDIWDAETLEEAQDLAYDLDSELYELEIELDY